MLLEISSNSTGEFTNKFRYNKEYNLVNMEAVKKAYEDGKPDIVIHLAAKVGGIGANRANPGSFFYDNLMMGAQMMEVGRKEGIEKFVAKVPFEEGLRKTIEWYKLSYKKLLKLR